MGQLSAKLEDKYYLQKVKLGQGSFGVVWKGIEKDTSTFVAVKQMDKAMLPRRGVKRGDIENEVSVMKVVKHDNILQLLDFYEDSKNISFVLEYCDGGDFGDKVKERGQTLTEDEAAVWTRMIVSSIQALHRKDVCHRDIKPDNFMVSKGVIKLADFGLAIVVPQGKMLTEKCGTPAFMAPEQQGSRGYSHSVDMWAAGITMFMLLSGGRHPFVTSDNKLNNSALKEGALDFSSQQGLLAVFGQRRGFSESARTLCKSMVNPDTRARITAEVALKNTWLMTPNVAPAPVAAKPSSSKPENPDQQLQRRLDELEKENQNLKQVGARRKGDAVTMLPSTGSTAGRLHPKCKVRYNSSSYPGGLDCFVVSFNEADGTYNLSIRPHASLDNISPDPKATAAEAWPTGTLVSYVSQTANRQLPAVIKSFVEGKGGKPGTYNLDLRECAEADRIRPRLQ